MESAALRGWRCRDRETQWGQQVPSRALVCSEKLEGAPGRFCSSRTFRAGGRHNVLHCPCHSTTARILAANCSHQAAVQLSYLISHRRAPCSARSSLIHLLVWIILQNSFKASLVPMQFCLDLIWLQKIIMSEPSLKVLYIFLDSVLENTSVANLTSHWILLLFHTNPLGIQFLWQ